MDLILLGGVVIFISSLESCLNMSEVYLDFNSPMSEGYSRVCAFLSLFWCPPFPP